MKQIYILLAVLSGFFCIGQSPVCDNTVPPLQDWSYPNSPNLSVDKLTIMAPMCANTSTDRILLLNMSGIGQFSMGNTFDSYFAPYATNAALTTGLSGKMNNPTGNSGQYLNGLGVPTAFPSPTAQFNPIAGTNITLSGTYPNITFNASGSAPTFTTATRSLNTSYQINTTKNARVSYSVSQSVALTLILASGSTTVYLEISPNNSTWSSICQTGYSRSLAVSVALNDVVSGNLSGEVPAGYYVRIRTAGAGGGLTSGVPNVTYTTGQEVVY